MRFSFKHLILMIVCLLFLIASGACINTRPGDTPTTPSINFNSATPSQTITLTPTMVSTPTQTPASSSTYTKIVPSPSKTPSPFPTAVMILPTRLALTFDPTLPLATAQVVFQKYILKNGGCDLPCYWGITPGKTSWVDLQNVFRQFNSSVKIVQANEDYSFFLAIFLIEFPNNVISEPIDILFWVENQKVVKINATTRRQAQFSIKNLLQKHGNPGEVVIISYSRTYRDKIPYYLHIYYQDQGVVAEYEFDHAVFVGNKIRACFQNAISDNILLFPPDRIKTYEEAVKSTELDYFDYPYYKFLPLSKIPGGMDMESFYKRFRGPEENQCLDIPQEIWPMPY